MLYVAEQKKSSARVIGFGLAVVFHILLIWALANGLMEKAVKLAKNVTEVNIIDAAVEKAPPPPPPVLKTAPPPYVPPPEISINMPVEATTNTTAIQQVTSTDIVAPKSNPRYPNHRPPYPPSSMRAGEEGKVTLSLFINTSGRVDDAKVQKSSGYPALDRAALDAAKRDWRFTPGTKGGQPYAQWKVIVVTFRLTDG